tara:strand:- start:3529 stop:5475 length:1947 start_codon:yes stop_codon:yes gene_type:complete
MLGEIAGKQARKQGLAAGAVQAPTYEEIEQAAKLGRPVELPGDPASINIYENAVYESSLAVTESYYHTAASQAMQEAFAGAQAQAATPESMKEALDAVVDNYTEVFSSVSPTSAAKLHHALIQERNNKFVSYNKTWQTDNRKRVDTATLVSVDEVIENLPQVANGYQYNPDISPSWGFDLSRILELQKLQVQFGSRPDGLKTIDEKMDKFDEERLKVIREFIAESVVNGDFGSHDDAKMSIGDRARGLREGTFGTDIWSDEGGEESNTSGLANTLQHFYSTLTSDDRTEVATLIVTKKRHKDNLEAEEQENEKAAKDAALFAASDPINQLLNQPLAQITHEVLDEAIALVEESDLPHGKGPGIDAHLNKQVFIERIRKMRKELIQRESGGDVGATPQQIEFYNHAAQSFISKNVTRKQWEAFRRNNAAKLPETSNNGFSWTTLTTRYNSIRDANKDVFNARVANGQRAITAGLDRSTILRSDPSGLRIAAQYAAAFEQEMERLWSNGEDWMAASDVMSDNNLVATLHSNARADLPGFEQAIQEMSERITEGPDTEYDPPRLDSEGAEPEPEIAPAPEITPAEKVRAVIPDIVKLTEMVFAKDLTQDDYYMFVRNLLLNKGIDLGKAVNTNDARLGEWIKEQLRKFSDG